MTATVVAAILCIFVGLGLELVRRDQRLQRARLAKPRRHLR
jgi:hypothetical protein